jgi:hypothetical protein
LIDLGISRLEITGPSLGADPAEAAAAEYRLVKAILPALHAS